MKKLSLTFIMLGILLVIPFVFATGVSLNNFFARGSSNILYPIFTNNCNFTSTFNSVGNNFVTVANCPNYNGNPLTVYYNNTAASISENSRYIIATGNSSVYYVYQATPHLINFANGAYVIDKQKRTATFSVGPYGPSVVIQIMKACFFTP